jgi:hypothetical protein
MTTLANAAVQPQFPEDASRNFDSAPGRTLTLCRLAGSAFCVPFHKGFAPRVATTLVPDLVESGVARLHASSYPKAVSGSTGEAS